MPCRAGTLNRRVTFESPVTSQNAVGEETTDSWSEFATRWAQVEGVAATERFAQGQKFAEATHRFRIRHTDGITPSMRISWDGRTFDIEGAIDPDGMKEELHVFTVEDTG